MTKPSTTRPTSAMKALMPTASPGSTLLRSAISGTRCVRNPTWLVSTKAKGAEMLQKCQCLSGASVLWLIAAGLGDNGPRRTNSATAVPATTMPITTSSRCGVGETQCGNDGEQGGRHDQARHRGAAQRQIERETALVVEPLADGGGDRRQAGGVPARRHQRVEQRELPRRLDRRQQQQRDGGDGKAAQEDHARAEAADRPGDARQQQGAQHVVAGDDRGDQPGRPAARLLQLDQIDAVRIEAEAPGEHGGQKAGEDDPPAGAGGHRLVYERLTCAETQRQPSGRSCQSSVYQPAPSVPSGFRYEVRAWMTA